MPPPDTLIGMYRHIGDHLSPSEILEMLGGRIIEVLEKLEDEFLEADVELDVVHCPHEPHTHNGTFRTVQICFCDSCWKAIRYKVAAHSLNPFDQLKVLMECR